MNVTLNVTVTTPDAAIALINALNGNNQQSTLATTVNTAPTTPTPTAPVSGPTSEALPLPPTTHVSETYTIDQLRTAAMQLVDAGRQKEVLELIRSHGVQQLTDIPQVNYPAFMASLRSMGARI